MKRSLESATGSGRRSRLSLGVTLFIVILIVALVCVLTSALLSKYLTDRQIGEFVQQHADELQPPAASSSPGQVTNPPPGQNPQPNPPPPRPRNINLGFILAGLLGLVLALALSFLLAGRISRPLSGLTSATKNIAGGDYAERVKVGGGKEVEELGNAFNTLAESLERNEQLRQNMVADIAHELRNPLATLRGQLELLQDGKIEYDGETIDSLMEDVAMLTHLVEDLQQLSLVDAGQLEFDLKSVDVKATFAEVLSRFEREASTRQVRLEVEPSPGLPPVKADPLRLAQILGNLVSNSLMHSEKGGSIKLSAERSADEVKLAVVDTGSGVSPDELPHIFERFYRADVSRARATGGAGLGLSIARGLVEAQGGHIQAESEAGKGTSIYFTLPVYQA